MDTLIIALMGMAIQSMSVAVLMHFEIIKVHPRQQAIASVLYFGLALALSLLQGV